MCPTGHFGYHRAMTIMAKNHGLCPNPQGKNFPLDPLQSNSPTPQSLRGSLAGRHPQTFGLGKPRGFCCSKDVNSLSSLRSGTVDIPPHKVHISLKVIPNKKKPPFILELKPSKQRKPSFS